MHAQVPGRSEAKQLSRHSRPRARPSFLTLDLILAQFGLDEEIAMKNCAEYVSEALPELDAPQRYPVGV